MSCTPTQRCPTLPTMSRSVAGLLALVAVVGCECDDDGRTGTRADAGTIAGGMDSSIPVGTSDGSVPGRDAGKAVCGPDTDFDAGQARGREDCDSGPAPGCVCETAGETAPCLLGRQMTCTSRGEFGNAWGPCLGSCFSSGSWVLDNTSPCFITYGGSSDTYAVSTIPDGMGGAACPDVGSMPPPPAPGEDWSPNRLTVDCEGRFELCYVIKAGDAQAPSPSDCVLTSVCTEAWYMERNVTQEFPPLPSWSSSDPACARRFQDTGGYGEMTVFGTTLDCEVIDDDLGSPLVFNRVSYCPSCCNDDSCTDGFDCSACRTGGSGSF